MVGSIIHCNHSHYQQLFAFRHLFWSRHSLIRGHLLRLTELYIPRVERTILWLRVNIRKNEPCTQDCVQKCVFGRMHHKWLSSEWWNLNLILVLFFSWKFFLSHTIASLVLVRLAVVDVVVSFAGGSWICSFESVWLAVVVVVLSWAGSRLTNFSSNGVTVTEESVAVLHI